MSKKLGQHFLKNEEKIKEIIDNLDLEKGDVVIEIGAGHGELTRKLVNGNWKLVSIEKDKKLYEKLVNSNWKLRNVEFINGDALKVLPKLITNYQLPITNYKIIGNIPYYITGRLFRVLGDLITNYQLPITTMVFTVQKEVAERISAQPPRMNLLAASVQFWAEPKFIGSIPKKDFSPPPEVDSAILKLIPKPITSYKLPITTSYQLLITNYYKIIKILFKQPRKTILNNLSSGLQINKRDITENLKKLKISPNDRPQNLNLDEIIKIARSFLV